MKIAEFDSTSKGKELGRRLSGRVLREVISCQLDGQPVQNRRLIEKLKLARKRPTVAKAVLALVLNHLGECGIAVQVQ